MFGLGYLAFTVFIILNKICLVDTSGVSKSNFNHSNFTQHECQKRKYNDSYIEYGFTCIINDEEERPQCVIWNKVLSNDSLKPTKLKQHLHKVHRHHKDKNRSFFERHASALKRMKLDSNGTYFETYKNAIETSYYVTLKLLL